MNNYFWEWVRAEKEVALTVLHESLLCLLAYLHESLLCLCTWVSNMLHSFRICEKDVALTDLHESLFCLLAYLHESVLCLRSWISIILDYFRICLCCADLRLQSVSVKPYHHACTISFSSYYGALTQLALQQTTSFTEFAALAEYFSGAGLYKARRRGWEEFTTRFGTDLFEGDDGTKYSCNSIGDNGDVEFYNFCDTLASAMSTSLRRWWVSRSDNSTFPAWVLMLNAPVHISLTTSASVVCPHGARSRLRRSVRLSAKRKLETSHFTLWKNICQCDAHYAHMYCVPMYYHLCTY